MIERRMWTCGAVAVGVALAMLAGCDGSSSPDAVGAAAPGGGGSAGGSTETPGWLLTAAPEGAVNVGEAKQSVSEGDEVALRGRIGGRADPMSADSAVFVIMDVSVPSCADEEGDNCATPWDYCCEPRESIAASNATVQLVDDTGAPLAIDLRRHGLKPLDEVIVVGRVAPRPSEQTLVVKATGLYRAGG
jgi:hypothetical protein